MFTTIKGTKINPVDYIRDYVSTHDNIQIFVGCDSQNTKETTTYVTAIVLYSPGNGGHIIYEKERTTKEKVRSIRLMNEVWKSVSIANDLVAAGIQKPDYIDIDDIYLELDAFKLEELKDYISELKTIKKEKLKEE